MYERYEREDLANDFCHPSAAYRSAGRSPHREMCIRDRSESVEQAAKLPQAERILDKGYEILYLTEEVDEFVMNTLGEVDGKALKNVNDGDALPESEEEKAETEKKAEENKDVLDFVKETLGDRVKEVRVSKILKSAPVCMTADGPVSLEMEKYFQRVDPNAAKEMKAARVLELNPDSGAFAALRSCLLYTSRCV